MGLRLDQLPNRTPVRMTVSLGPQLSDDLQDYARIYEQTYGAKEKPETLIPAMLETFLNSDAGFKRARKALSQTARKGD